MSKIIEFESEFGTILIESNEPERSGRQNFSSGGNTTERAKEKFEESVNVLQHVSKAVVGQFSKANDELKPSEVEIKIGIKFTAEAGAFIAKTSAEGNLEVTLKWTNKDKTMA